MIWLAIVVTVIAAWSLGDVIVGALFPRIAGDADLAVYLRIGLLSSVVAAALYILAARGA